METNEIVVLVVVVLVLLAIAAALMAAQKRKRERLRSTFGPEYDRTVDSSGRRRDAERDLAARADRRSSLDIRPLPAADRQAFAARWTATQADFVDRPAEAVKSADTLVTQVMGQRGYPVGDFDQQARDISVDHAEVVQEYRAAHDISVLNDRQQATTEQLRQAMVHYRALFTELLGDEDVAGAAAPVYPTDTADRGDRDGSGRESSYREDTSYPQSTGGRDLDDRDAVIGGAAASSGDQRGMRTESRLDQDAQTRFEANHDGPYGDSGVDDHAGHALGHDAGHDGRRDDAYDGSRDGGHDGRRDDAYDGHDDRRDGTLSGGAGDRGYATDQDRRVREGGLPADREQPQVLHLRRERLEDDSTDRDLPPRS